MTLTSIVLLAGEWFKQEIVLMGTLTVFLVSTVLSAEDALAGFGTSSILAVPALFIVARGIENTNVLEYVCRVLLGNPKGLTAALLRMAVTFSLVHFLLDFIL